ncbi:hypothetical protein AAFF_G00141490 [Aldrovandia affinis]|uniref:Uncharacterized protein n=1 Tax=Aldrovandia affinis TaxID=143900 RepID=A0AAD7X305_9TELE|nr:hypothetical protein AAFF_G00141490 [Aldrovandia affinis]
MLHSHAPQKLHEGPTPWVLRSSERTGRAKAATVCTTGRKGEGEILLSCHGGLEGGEPLAGPVCSLRSLEFKQCRQRGLPPWDALRERGREEDSANSHRLTGPRGTRGLWWILEQGLYRRVGRGRNGIQETIQEEEQEVIDRRSIRHNSPRQVY